MTNNAIAAAIAAVIAGGLIMHYSKPRGIRNNNPLNLRISGDNWQGLAGDDGEFFQFESPFYGLRAAARTLRTYRAKHGLATISEIINRWAPDTENDTQSYIESVSQKTGLFPDQEILSASDYQKVITAMIYHENGEQPYPDELIKKAVIEGLYS